MTEQELAETRKRNEEARERSYRRAMLRSSHKRWQRAREWDGRWANPVPEGAPVSIWRKGHDCWNYHSHADRVDWTQVRAYRLEHGTPYPDAIPAPIHIPAELAGTLPPALQFRLDRIDAALARLEALAAHRGFWDEFKPMLERFASVDRSPEGGDHEDGRHAEHESAVANGETPEISSPKHPRITHIQRSG